MKIDAMVEVVTLAPEVYLEPFSRNRIRDVFIRNNWRDHEEYGSRFKVKYISHVLTS